VQMPKQLFNARFRDLGKLFENPLDYPVHIAIPKLFEYLSGRRDNRLSR
jgi:hypothetical protein